MPPTRSATRAIPPRTIRKEGLLHGTQKLPLTMDTDIIDAVMALNKELMQFLSKFIHPVSIWNMNGHETNPIRSYEISKQRCGRNEDHLIPYFTFGFHDSNDDKPIFSNRLLFLLFPICGITCFSFVDTQKDFHLFTDGRFGAK
jgi:hypothetical protein